MILLMVLYVCKTSLTLRNEHGLRLFKNRAMRRIIGPKRAEVTGGWIGPLNEELHNLYCSPSIISMNESFNRKWAGHITAMKKKMNIQVGGKARRKSLRITTECKTNV
jgi:hypothetical protein